MKEILRRNYLWMLTAVLALPFLLLPAAAGARTPAAAQGDVITVTGEDPGALADALARAEAGDTLEVSGGPFSGPLVVDKAVTLVGRGWPVIDGAGEGTVVRITAQGVALRGLVIRNSGDSLDEENSGIAVEAADAEIANNRLEETLFGIYLREAPNSTVRDNVIHSKDLAVPRRGDAIRVWYSNGVRIENNVIDKGRDVVLWYSEDLGVFNNRVTDGRYGLHFMYCDDASIEGNVLSNNSVGAFLMYSRRLRLHNNTIAYNRGPSGYGVGLKDMDDAVIEENVFVDNRIGIFLDNSPREVDSTGHIKENVLAYNDMGISLLPSVRNNEFSGNSFVENQEQVSVLGGGRLEGNAWSVDGEGNYWSDYAGYDANGDGLGDLPYRSERLFENLMDRNSQLRLFLFSPAVQAVNFAARAIPFVKPQPKLTDDYPKMTPSWPTGAPPLPQATSRPAWMAAAALLAGGLTLLFLPRVAPAWRRSREEDERDGQGAGEASERAPVLTNERGSPMIDVQNLTKRFGRVTAVDDVSFSVEEGEAVALWGANGAGKTTALRCVLGVIPYEGEIRLAGHDVRYNGRAARAAVGFVPQELTFHDDMTVVETLRFYAALKKATSEPLHDLMEQLALAEHAGKRVQELSGGLKQRLALAIALLADPPVLVLDEPTSNLDAQARDDFLDLLSGLKKAGKTLIFSSHRLSEVVGLADRVLILESGQLAADCRPDELSERTGWRATLRLLLPDEWIEPALDVLDEKGYATSRNGHGIWVRVPPQEKVDPLSLLVKAGVPIRDFELE
ncbi:MAG: nitrous oxide reductase family maturation protein NosD [Candidatus Promineifilaceae bacterium]|nr:nitrous oxide reductase family maturation protein NosD [Candidatus Promineifilaceae bacterium]